MCTNKNVSNNMDVMTDDMVLGVFDTDGSILIVLDSHEKDGTRVADGLQPFGLRNLGQSTSI